MDVRCFLFGHRWLYARGRSVAQDITGRGRKRYRPSCVRRVCRCCGKAQEVSYFRTMAVCDSDYFKGDPVWLDLGHKKISRS